MPSYSNSKKATVSKFYCQHCKNLGETFDTHNKDMCPKLRALKCHYCGANGHSQKYCDARKFDEERSARQEFFREKEKRIIAFEAAQNQQKSSNKPPVKISSAFSALGADDDSSSDSDKEPAQKTQVLKIPAKVVSTTPRAPPNTPVLTPVAVEVQPISNTVSQDYSDSDKDLPSMYSFRASNLIPAKKALGISKPKNWADYESSDEEN